MLLLPRWWEREGPVANANCDTGIDLSPISEAPADAVKAAWTPLLEGQDVPLIWERVYDDAQPGNCL